MNSSGSDDTFAFACLQCKRTLRSENDFAFGNSFYTYFESKFVLKFIDKIFVSFKNFIIKMFIFLDSRR